MNLTKFYVWSIVLEPIAFLTGPKLSLGISFSFSRILQCVVLLIFLTHFLDKSRLILITNIDQKNYKPYTYFILYSVFACIFGAIYGAYIIPPLAFLETLNVSLYRPFIELMMAIYYYFYFVFLFKYIIKTRRDLNYFFKVFSRVFYLSLILGLLSLFFMFFFYEEGFKGIPRKILEGVNIGVRFNGLFGEPRDAFGFLLLGLVILWLKDQWFKETKLTIFILLVILYALFYTKSASGILGLLFTCGLILFYYVRLTNIRTMLLFIGFIFLILFILVFSFLKFPRLLTYIDTLPVLYSVLSSGTPPYEPILGYINNVYPVWHRWIEISNLNVIPTILGTGLGSSSIINNIYFAKESINVINPNATVIRLFYEVGVIGIYLLLAAFLKPIKQLPVSFHIINKLIILMLIILGAYMAHRSVIPFFFLGVALVTIRNLNSDNKFI